MLALGGKASNDDGAEVGYFAARAAMASAVSEAAKHLANFDETHRYIRHIRNLQIVNGGQTTASIFNTAKKDKADISKIYVQVKLSVIKDSEQYANIVSRISQYAPILKIKLMMQISQQIIQL